MGYGDDIMASGHARTIARQTGKRVRIVDRRGQPRWSNLWRKLEWIVQPGKDKIANDFTDLMNCPGRRPYFFLPFSHAHGQRFDYSYRVRDHVGDIVFSDDELRFAHNLMHDTELGPDYMIIEPNLAPTSNINKQWGFVRWQTMVDAIGSGVRKIQLIPDDLPAGTALGRLRNVSLIRCPSFRHAAAAVSLAKCSVLPEGGLHHAAGVTRAPAVVLFGGVVPVEVLGYPWHLNIRDTGPGSPCGKWRACSHCAECWRRITPSEVAQKAWELWTL